MKRNTTVTLLALLLFFAAALHAQYLTGTLTGTVIDATEAVIPSAKVTATDTSTGQTATATTNASGIFTITNLSNGFYRVVVEAPGFAKLTIQQVQVNVSQTARVIAKLEVAKTGTEVVVTTEQTLVQTESAELKSNVDRAQIMNLPLPTRNPLDLVRTMPGIVSPTNQGSTADAFVHGLRGNSTNLTQDGINVADNFVKTSAFFALSAPTVDTIGEFSVSIGGVGVDAGFGAAQVSMVTQRGSNAFHGSLFWFQRNDNLNANVFFNNQSGTPRPFQLQNRIGVSAGGPVYIPRIYKGKNRTWLFGTYEAFREPRSQSRTRTVMESNARTGLFTYTPTSGGGSRQINLLSIGTLGTTGAAPTINKAVMDFYNKMVPTTGFTDSGCSGDGVNIRCLTFNIPGTNKTDRYTLRADHQLTGRHSISFVFNQSDFNTIQDFLNGTESMFPNSLGGGQSSRRQVLTWAVQSTIGTNKTNEGRVGYTRAPVNFDLYEDYKQTGGYQVNFGGTVTDPTLTQTNMPQGRNSPVRQVSDNFAWQKGRHSLRFGGEYRLMLANSYMYNTVVPRVILGTNSANPNGITADKFPGGISSGDLTRASGIFNAITGLLGSINQGVNHTSPTSGFVKGVPRRIDPIQHNLSGYFQDNFKLRPNLTVQAGARYEYQGVFDLRNGLILAPQDGMAGFWGPAGINNLFNPRTTPAVTDTPLNFAGGHNGKPLYQRDLNNFAPFLGFAWDPKGNGKMAVRGAVAAHYTQDGFTLFQISSTGNTGLFSVVSNTTPSGALNLSSVPTPPAPTAVFPVSQRQNMINNTAAALWYFDPNLRTPYVLEWNLGIQRQLWNRFAIEARYVGNHAVKQFRSWSINEIDIQNNGLLTEFLNAQKNLTVGRTSFANQGLPGQVPLPIFDKLFAGVAAASGFANSTFVTNLNQNQIGAMFDAIRRSTTYRVNREASFPLNFFVANPFAAGANLVNNAGWSIYHGLELEVTRRFASGLFFQANYTFSKVLADTTFVNSQQENQNYRSLRNTRLDKSRASIDVPQSFTANFLYPLPLGKGKRLARSAPTVIDKIIGGWELQGLTKWSTGSPFQIMSNRATTGSLFGTTAVIRNMTASQLKKQTGVFRSGPGIYWLNPNSGLLTISGATSRAVVCTAGQTTPCFDHPGVNEWGNLPYMGFNSARFFDQDASLIKRTKIPSISERFNFELRLEAFNLFNHPSFRDPSNAIDNADFGQLRAVVDTVRGGGVTSRIVQFALRVNW
jgi:hypothetical protein